jgi:hypothetical protein
LGPGNTQRVAPKNICREVKGGTHVRIERGRIGAIMSFSNRAVHKAGNHPRTSVMIGPHTSWSSAVLISTL